MQTPLEVIDGPGQAAALLDPTRLQLLEQFREPASAAQAARALGLPRQRVGHHVRVLLQKGLLEDVGERRKGNFVERLVQATARAYVVAPQALGGLEPGPGRLRDRFSTAYLLAAAARTIGEVAQLQRAARRQKKRLPTVTIETEVRFSSPLQQSAFVEELTGYVAELAGRYHDEDSEEGRRFRFAVTGHPAVPEGGTDEKAH